MDQNTARKLIQETFQNSFDKEKFIILIKNLLNHIEEKTFIYRGQYIPEAYSSYVKTFERIGKYQDDKTNKIDILIVNLKKETSLERARSMQRNFIGWYLNGSRGDEFKDGALVAFISPNEEDWRFSLVKMEYKIDATGKRIKTKQEFTPARRWSFLVGKNENSHTAQSRLVPILEDDTHNPGLNSLEEAFNIERVTKEFFEKYRELFLKLKDSLDEIVKMDKKIKADFEKKNVNTVDFAKKLLGQIVFLYFLQKKGWFGVKRNEEWGSGSKRFLRELFEKKHGDYKNFFNDALEPLFYQALRYDRSTDDDYFAQFDCRILFLNGGLFDPLNDYNWVDTDIELPNEIFSNDIKTKEGDIGSGILDIFDRYNFTVKEDEPLEKEVAVDPEMLGKVFENLLEVKDRKSKGTYYTPREIVHYMCQESLANYLATELEGKASKEDIETLIKYGESVVEHDSRVASVGRETKSYSFKLPPSVRKHAKEIDDKLASIRVCDPAVGSGAFPVGMMNEVIRTRNALTPHINGDLSAEALAKAGRTPYNFKRHAIQNCLYGVDIDAGAVEIAKLRLWLSLIVDEEERETIQPLPNLDYKIVQGNSLLSVEKNLFNQSLFAQLEQLKPLYFNETSAKKKREYKEQIDKLINQITNGRKDFDFEIYFSEVFHEKKGFDVVIANPPYVVTKKEKFNSYEWNTDLYLMFYEVSLKKIVRDSGIVCFISPRYCLVNRNATDFRRYLLNEIDLRIIVETSPFEAVTENIIVIIQKRKPSDREIIVMQESEGKIVELNVISRQYCLENSNLEILTFLTNDRIAILNKIDGETTVLKNIAVYKRGAEIGKKVLREMSGKPILIGLDLYKYKIDFRNAHIDKSHKEYIRLEGFFNQKDLIYLRRVTSKLIASIPDKPYAFNKNIYGVKIFNKEYNGRYVLSLLNSKLLNFYYRNKFSTKKEEVFPEIQLYLLESLPIRKASLVDQKPFINLVGKILAITKDDDYLENSTKQAKVREYEKQIDQLVYKLYDLTTEEIKIVEGVDK